MQNEMEWDELRILNTSTSTSMVTNSSHVTWNGNGNNILYSTSSHSINCYRGVQNFNLYSAEDITMTSLALLMWWRLTFVCLVGVVRWWGWRWGWWWLMDVLGRFMGFFGGGEGVRRWRSPTGLGSWRKMLLIHVWVSPLRRSTAGPVCNSIFIAHSSYFKIRYFIRFVDVIFS